jgi:hypothetical protein
VGEIPNNIIMSHGGGGGVYIILIVGWFIPVPHRTTQKASVGMDSGYDYPYKSCLCILFGPAIPIYFTLQFYSIFTHVLGVM